MLKLANPNKLYHKILGEGVEGPDSCDIKKSARNFSGERKNYCVKISKVMLSTNTNTFFSITKHSERLDLWPVSSLHPCCLNSQFGESAIR